MSVGQSLGQSVGRDEEDARWVTKVELAKFRGISIASADRLVRRQKWRRQRGNDKRARILVPLSWLTSDKSSGDDHAATDAAPDSTEDVTEDAAADGSGDNFHIISVFERQIDHEREEKKQLFEALQAAGERERELTDRIADLQAERDSLLENLSMWRRWRWRRRRRKEREEAAKRES